MERHGLRLAWLLSLVVGFPMVVSAQEDGPSRSLAHETHPGAGEHRIVRGQVQAVHGPRVFTVQTRSGSSSRTTLVLGPDARSTPAAGATVEVHGIVRQLEESDLENTPGWDGIDEETRTRLTGSPVLVAITLLSANSVQAQRPPETPPGPPERTKENRRRAASADVVQTTVRPSTLADQIGDLAGRQVRVPYARVVGVLDPRAFLIDTSTSLPPAIGNRDRVLVLVADGALRVSPETLVASAVVVEGVARTLLGMQVSGEVPWPARLDRATIERLEIRAVILASSVHTADGVELTNPPPSSPAPAASTRVPRGNQRESGGRSRAAVR